MEGFYRVYFGKKAVGKAELQRKGLYYRIICRCDITDKRVYRLLMVQSDRQESVGVLLPDGDGAILDKMIAAKRIGKGKVQFVLSCIEKTEKDAFVPIVPEEPFLYIDRLQKAFLASEQGKIGIRL